MYTSGVWNQRWCPAFPASHTVPRTWENGNAYVKASPAVAASIPPAAAWLSVCFVSYAYEAIYFSALPISPPSAGGSPDTATHAP